MRLLVLCTHYSSMERTVRSSLLLSAALSSASISPVLGILISSCAYDQYGQTLDYIIVWVCRSQIYFRSSSTDPTYPLLYLYLSVLFGDLKPNHVLESEETCNANFGSFRSGGTGGLAVANRLSEGLDVRVVVIEGHKESRRILIMVAIRSVHVDTVIYNMYHKIQQRSLLSVTRNPVLVTYHVPHDLNPNNPLLPTVASKS